MEVIGDTKMDNTKAVEYATSVMAGYGLGEDGTGQPLMSFEVFNELITAYMMGMFEGMAQKEAECKLKAEETNLQS